MNFNISPIEKTPRGFYKIVITNDQTNERKVIIARSPALANEQKDYYCKMLRGVTTYNAWLQENRSK